MFRLKKSMCAALGAQFDVSTDKKCFLVVIFNFMRSGSLTVGSSISGGNFNSGNDATTAVNSAFSSSTELDGASVVSSTAVSSGFTNESSESTNLGLILGLSIPLVLLRTYMLT